MFLNRAKNAAAPRKEDDNNIPLPKLIASDSQLITAENTFGFNLLTEAAPITRISIFDSVPPAPIYLNGPFHFTIEEKASQSILFIGKIEAPARYNLK